MATRFGVLVPQGWRLDLVNIKDPVEKYEHMTRFGQEAERLGYDSIWVYDHFHTVPVQQLETNFECWIASAALARDTTTVRIGQMVTCNNYRPPSLLAKMASTVDVLSHGRLDFGIGAGWYEAEYKAFGFPFPGGPERLKMLEEGLQVIRAMWTEPYATFEGKYYTVEGAINEPKGVQQPHIPIWVGGSGEKVTLKLVAKYADACNISVGTDMAQYQHKLDMLKGHCDTLDRDWASVLKSTHLFVTLLEPGQSEEEATAPHLYGRSLADYKKTNFVVDPQGLSDVIEQLNEMGFEYHIFYFRNDLTKFDTIQRVASDVIPKFRN